MTKKARLRDKRRDDVLDNAVDEVILFRIAAEVHERQNRDRRLVGNSRRSLCGPASAGPHSSSRTAPTNRRPLRGSVLISLCRVAGIADCAPRGVDPVEQRRLRNGAPVPDRRQKIVLADHTVTVPDQVDKKIEDLGLDGHKRRTPPQLAAIRVERTFLEQIAQDFIPLFAPRPQRP